MRLTPWVRTGFVNGTPGRNVVRAVDAALAQLAGASGGSRGPSELGLPPDALIGHQDVRSNKATTSCVLPAACRRKQTTGSADERAVSRLPRSEAGPPSSTTVFMISVEVRRWTPGSPGARPEPSRRTVERPYHVTMGIKNYLIEGVSGAGKTSICKELQRRGYYAINGDNELAYQGDPETGKPTDGLKHEHHIWNVDRVKALVASQDEQVTFFCGGSRNFSKFIDLFDGVFVLEVGRDTLYRRLHERSENEWGGKQAEQELIMRLHQTKEDIPKNAIVVDATAPIARVVDEIVRQSDVFTPHAARWRAGTDRHRSSTE